MSKIYDDNYLIECGVEAIWSSHQNMCVDNCDCSEIAMELEKRFLNV
jgi:hypothetical protein